MAVISLALFVNAALPVANVFLLCLVGVGLARKGILDSRGRQVLSQVIFWVFTPALTFTKLAASVNLANLKLWWFLPVNMFISIGVGLVIGWVFGYVLKPPKGLRPHIMCAAACGNVGNLPLVLIVGVCSDRSWPFMRALPNGQCQESGIAYVAFSMWIAGNFAILPNCLFQYTVAYNMLKLPKTLPDKMPQVALDRAQSAPIALGRAQSAQMQRPKSRDHTVLEVISSRKSPRVLPKSRTPRTQQQQQLALKDSAVELHLRAKDADHTSGRGEHTSGRGEESGFATEVSSSKAGIASADSSEEIVLHGPSALGRATAADGVGGGRDDESAPRSQRSKRAEGESSDEEQPFINGRVLELDSAGPGEGPSGSGRWTTAGWENGTWEDGEHGVGSQRRRRRRWWRGNGPGAARRQKKRREIQRWLSSIPWGSYLNMPTVAALAGLSVGCVAAVKGLLFGAAPPLAFVAQALDVLAGGMIPAMMLTLGASLHKGPGSANVQKRVIVGVALCRLIIIPLLGMGFVFGLHRLGTFTSPDPLFMFVLLLMHSTPTAVNLQTVATLNQNGEAEISCLLFWQYVLSLITLPIWLSVYVAILG